MMIPFDWRRLIDKTHNVWELAITMGVGVVKKEYESMGC